MERQRYIRLVAECARSLQTAMSIDAAIGRIDPRHDRERAEQLACLQSELFHLTHQTHVILWPAHGHEDEIWWLADTVDRAYDHRYAVGVAQGWRDRLWQVHLVAPGGKVDAAAVAGEATCHGYDLAAYRGLVEAVA